MAKKAFVIGINTLRLSFCCRDAGLMKECLEKRGYQVIDFQKGLDKWEILKKFDAFLDGSNIVDTILFYFSGHGVIYGGKLLLITDNDTTKAGNRIPIDYITDSLRTLTLTNWGIH
jgi:uncharacterized caspase-like protein